MVFSPTRSFHAAGTRTEPAVSEPIAAAASPKATDAAAPDEEPPGASSGSLMFGGVAVTGFTPRPGEGELGHVGLAEADEPGPRRRRDGGRVALRHAARAAAPSPPRWRRRRCRRGPSSSTGTPSSGPRRSPARARAAAASASARARSAVTRA